LEAFADAAPGSGVLASVDDPSLGPDNAQLTIVEFADFGCPYSKEESYVITALAKQYPTVKFIYRDFPLDDIHPGANLAAQAGECAHEQGAFWEYHDLLYRHSGEFTTTALIDYAEQLDLNTAQFTECLTSGAYRDEVLNDARDGVSAGVEGTPTLFFNGQKISGAIPYQTFVDLIEAFTKTDPEINQ
jgi:protein-disulfide isomerase